MEQTQTPVAQAPAPEAQAPVAQPTVTEQKTETKPVETQAPAAQAAKPADQGNPVETQSKTIEEKPQEAKPQTPEKYELKLPEKSPLQPKALEEIAAFAKENGLSQEQAQGLVKRESEAISRYVDGQKEELSKVNNGAWLQQLESDNEVGGKNIEESGHLAYKAAVHYFGESFVSDIKRMHLNNYPVLFKGLVRLGKTLSNDSFVQSNTRSAGNKTMAQRLYGDNAK